MILPQSLREGVIAWKPDGQDWADSLPVLVEHCRELWQLEIGEPFEGGCTALVAPAERADGSSCVLKLRYPDDESRHEPEALERWAGNGAVRLLERDEVTGALLLEHLQPGTSLREVADIDEAIALACGVLRRLWQPVEAGHPFATDAGLRRRLGRRNPASVPHPRPAVRCGVATCGSRDIRAAHGTTTASP